MITIVLADDHDVVRQGLRALLETKPGFRIVGEAKDGLTAVALTERHRPQVLIVDLMMPGLGGLEVVREVAQRCPDTRTIVLSMHAVEQYVVQSLRNGALAYVLKDSGVDVLLEAINEILAGRRYLSAPLSSMLISSYVQTMGDTVVDPHAVLTTREREVLHLAADGLTNSEIAARLSISARTAESHRGRVMHKLGLKGQADLVRHAFKTGILVADPPAPD